MTARRVAVYAALNAVGVIAYLVVAGQVGFFSHLSASLFWSPDSHTYRDVANWLLGGGPNPAESRHRPFLYPLLLGVSGKIAADPGIWALNAVCWFGALNLTAASVVRLTGRMSIAAVAFLVLATNASLIVLSFQALTETLTAFLEALWIFGLALTRIPPASPREIVPVLLPITLLVVVKPEFQVQLVIALVLLAITIWRVRQSRMVLAGVAAACCLPVMFQVGLMATANHFVGVSNSGDIEFKSYYVSQVYASLNGLPDDLVAARNIVGEWSDRKAVSYLVQHRGVALSTLVSNFHRNMTSGSNFVDASQQPGLADLIRSSNRTMLKVHALFVPIVVLALWRRRDVRIVLLYVFAGLVTTIPTLIVDQGDRYIVVALPLWVAAYGLAVADLLPDVSHVVQLWQRRPQPA
ncbi:MAG TPA: hypothetical protein VHQ03_07425 [Candidatus Dormibacteraeota bacterium]|nr:hypothetical protein [Candidatus Dormibacteraeota bacterium]